MRSSGAVARGLAFGGGAPGLERDGFRDGGRPRPPACHRPHCLAGRSTRCDARPDSVAHQLLARTGQLVFLQLQLLKGLQLHAFQGAQLLVNLGQRLLLRAQLFLRAGL